MGTLAALLQQLAGRLLSLGGLSTFGPCPDQARHSSATWASAVITGAVRSKQEETVPSREGSTAGRRAPARPQSVTARGAGHPARSSATAISLPQGVGRVQALRNSVISGARVPPTAGASQLPAGLSNSAPSARGPGAEPARGPGQHTHQPRLRASAQQAASSSSACEATPVSRGGSLPWVVVLGSWADGTYHKEGDRRRRIIGVWTRYRSGKEDLSLNGHDRSKANENVKAHGSPNMGHKADDENIHVV
ncbi:hypothetical protein NDU88_002299 [Pleurodeles waltl]|uniref:Uncharacterized protein n=1 Tax=Pleurodeles waltl TaxID=8319 RepID=A0AAV7P911_PLEWA|nr:hypothetical protein NDU88_002299 [Pleurodeles waltl]